MRRLGTSDASSGGRQPNRSDVAARRRRDRERKARRRAVRRGTGLPVAGGPELGLPADVSRPASPETNDASGLSSLLHTDQHLPRGLMERGQVEASTEMAFKTSSGAPSGPPGDSTRRRPAPVHPLVAYAVTAP